MSLPAVAAGLGVNAFVAPHDVPIRYIGITPVRRDTFFDPRHRVWRRGEVVKVPAVQAEKYLRHPAVWIDGNRPWDGGAADLPLSAEQIVEALRRGDLALLERREPALAALLQGPETPPAPTGVVPLHPEDAGRLLAHVPALARVLTQVGAINDKLDEVRDLLTAFPPLLEGCVEIERQGKNRPDVLRKLALMAPPVPGEDLLG